MLLLQQNFKRKMSETSDGARAPNRENSNRNEPGNNNNNKSNEQRRNKRSGRTAGHDNRGFQGKCADLKSAVYDVTAGRDTFTKTARDIAEYVGREYDDAGEFRTGMVNLVATDKIKNGEMRVEHCPTEEMRADFQTKPQQGNLFRRSRQTMLNLPNAAVPDTAGPQECVGTPSWADVVRGTDGPNANDPGVDKNPGTVNRLKSIDTKAYVDSTRKAYVDGKAHVAKAHVAGSGRNRKSRK